MGAEFCEAGGKSWTVPCCADNTVQKELGSVTKAQREKRFVETITKAVPSQSGNVRRRFCIADAVESIDVYGADIGVVVGVCNLLH